MIKYILVSGLQWFNVLTESRFVLEVQESKSIIPVLIYTDGFQSPQSSQQLKPASGPLLVLLLLLAVLLLLVLMVCY